MFAVRNHARHLPDYSLGRAVRGQRIRWASGPRTEILQATTSVAQELSDTNLWSYGRWGKKLARPKGDKARVNIVDEKLCDDAITYLKPSLQRHVGCDIIDIYPGAGLWSRKLHDVLQPRSHILMEPDESLYRPFLEPLLSKPNTTIVPKSGIIWRELSEILNLTYLPHQVERDPRSPEATERNDTLLVTANLAFYPKKRYRAFDSVAQLVLFQFISSIRASSLFQKYGLVRMLLWIDDDDKHGILPRSVQRRKRLAIEGELSTDWIAEVACADGAPGTKVQWFLRDRAIDMESGRRVLQRMGESGLAIPPGRETQLVRDIRAEDGNAAGPAGSKPATFDRRYKAELENLEARFAGEAFDEASRDYRRLKALRYKRNWDENRAEAVLELLKERDAIADLCARRGAGNENAAARESAWNEEIQGLNKNLQKEFILGRDNLHIFRQSPPVLNWDRRWLEPLAVRPTEFFPNVPCALLDIQPKAMHPLLRAMGPSSDRAGDVFEMLLRGIMQLSGDPISKSLESVWPGSAEGVLPRAMSLRERRYGGMPVSGWAELSARSLNERQLVEILELWMGWPFRPTYPELVARVSDDHAGETFEDGGGGAAEFL